VTPLASQRLTQAMPRGLALGSFTGAAALGMGCTGGATCAAILMVVVAALHPPAAASVIGKCLLAGLIGLLVSLDPLVMVGPLPPIAGVGGAIMARTLGARRQDLYHGVHAALWAALLGFVWIGDPRAASTWPWLARSLLCSVVVGLAIGLFYIVARIIDRPAPPPEEITSHQPALDAAAISRLIHLYQSTVDLLPDLAVRQHLCELTWEGQALHRRIRTLQDLLEREPDASAHLLDAARDELKCLQEAATRIEAVLRDLHVACSLGDGAETATGLARLYGLRADVASFTHRSIATRAAWQEVGWW
jgi:hypothetical protein